MTGNCVDSRSRWRARPVGSGRILPTKLELRAALTVLWGEMSSATDSATHAPEPSGKSIASLIFGILGLVGFLPCVGPLVAIFLGTGERDGVAKAGVILGWISLVIYAAIALLALLVLLFGGIAAFANG